MEQVSWQLYVTLVGAVLVVYYLFVGIKYYRQDFQNLITRVLKPPSRKDSEPIQVADLQALNLAARLLEQSFDSLNGSEATREEALSFVRDLLSDISGLSNPVIRQALEQLIASKAKAVFGLELNQADMKTIW